MRYGVQFTPSVSGVHQAAQTAYAQETAQNTEEAVKQINQLIEELEKEKAERKKSDRTSMFLAIASLLISAGSLLFEILK